MNINKCVLAIILVVLSFIFFANKAKAHQTFDSRTSIVDYLKSKKMASSVSARRQLAKELGMRNYAPTASGNEDLLRKILTAKTAKKFVPKSSIVDFLKSKKMASSVSARRQLAKELGMRNYAPTASGNEDLLRRILTAKLLKKIEKVKRIEKETVKNTNKKVNEIVGKKIVKKVNKMAVQLGLPESKTTTKEKTMPTVILTPSIADQERALIARIIAKKERALIARIIAERKIKESKKNHTKDKVTNDQILKKSTNKDEPKDVSKIKSKELKRESIKVICDKKSSPITINISPPNVNP